MTQRVAAVDDDGNFYGLVAERLAETYVDFPTSSVTYVASLLPEGWVDGGPDGGALAAACANGGRVVLPPGKIVAESTITPTRTLVLEGAGGNLHGAAQSPSVVEFKPGLTGIILNTVDTVGSTLRGFHLTSQSAGAGGAGVGVLVKAGRVTFEDVTITYFGSHGIHVDATGGTNPHVVNTIGVNSLRYNGGDGLRVTGQVNACTFQGLDIGYNGGWGINNGGRSNVFMHPHLLSNTGGAIFDDSIGNAYFMAYVEADANGIMDVVRFSANSTLGIWLSGGYGGKEPEVLAAGLGGWTLIRENQRIRRQIRIGASGGYGTGRATVIDQGVQAADLGRLRMENADGTTGTSLMRWGDTLLESTIEHRMVAGMRLLSSTGPKITAGAGTPEGVVAAPVGSLYQRTDGAAGTCLYVKESGTGTTGWVAK